VVGEMEAEERAVAVPVEVAMVAVVRGAVAKGKELTAAVDLVEERDREAASAVVRAGSCIEVRSRHNRLHTRNPNTPPQDHHLHNNRCWPGCMC
jgi:hypothetical protein